MEESALKQSAHGFRLCRWATLLGVARFMKGNDQATLQKGGSALQKRRVSG